MKRFQGTAASPGIGLGQAMVIRPKDLGFEARVVEDAAAEKARLDKALAAFQERTQAMVKASREKAGEHQAQILEGQLTMLGDPYLSAQIYEKIDQKQCAESAVWAALGAFGELLEASEDELTRQRATDIRDMRDALVGILLGREEPDLSHLPPDTILVVEELTPSMTTALDAQHVSAIVAGSGGVTSHAAILARAMSLPAVLSVPGAPLDFQDGEALIVDGDAGVVLSGAEEQILDEYRAKLAAQRADRAALEAYRDKPTQTADGKRVLLYGNVGSRDAQATVDMTGEGIGLFRSEFLFLERDALPSEEEQFAAYQKAVALFPDGEVIIRALDVGGDKAAPCLELPKEENPFLGFRAVRFLLEREDVFLPQLRAVLRASAFGQTRLMLPLVTRVSELRDAKALLEKAKSQLAAEGVAFDANLPVGVMMETPAAVAIADILALEAAFFSIGTNDLTQYVMAADRGNPKVGHIGSPFAPPVLRSIRDIIAAGHAKGIPVGMCGEAAAEARLIPVWLGLGLDEFSVSPAAILSTRREISRWSMDRAEEIARGALALDGERKVRAYLERVTEK